MKLHEQVITLIAADGGVFSGIPKNETDAFRRGLISFIEKDYPSICMRINHGRRFTSSLKDEILTAASEYRATYIV